MNKENKVLILSNIILVGFLTAVVFHYIMGFYIGFRAPFNSFLYPAYKSFCDFMEILPFVKDFAPYKFVTPWIAYFPLCYIILFPFTLIKNIFVSYLIFISFFMTYLVHMNIKEFSVKSFTKLQNFQNIFIITCLSYPVLYSLDKGNFDLILFILLGLSVYCFKSEKYLLSAVLLALENAMKPFPAMFLFLFLYKKRYKEFLLSIILTGILIVGGFMALKGNFFDQIIVFLKDLGLAKGLLNNSDNFGLTFTSSFYFPLKWLLCKVSSHPLLKTIVFTNFYNIFFIIMSVITIFFVGREKVFWKQITLLTLFMLMMPYLIYDHKLIFLFIPLWLFVNAKEKSKFDLIYTILFALLFIPKNLIILNSPAFHDPRLLDFLVGGNVFFEHRIYWSFISVSVILNPLIMFAFFWLIIIDQIKNQKAETKELDLEKE